MPGLLIAGARARWHALTHEHRLIMGALVAVAAFSVLGKAANVAKEIAIAWRFGVSAEVDAYLFVFNFINWPITVWFSVLTIVLIPLEARIRRESPEQLRIFRGQLLGVTVVLGLLIVAVAKIAIPILLTSRTVGLPARTTDLALEVVPTLAWYAFPGMLVSLYSTWMMSGGSNANTLLEGLPSLGIFLAVLFAAGIESPVWGTLFGVGLQVVCVAWPRVMSGEVRAPAFRLNAPAWSSFTAGFATMLVGQAIFSMTTLVDQFFAAGLGEGAISSLSYATRLISIVNAVVAIAVTRSTLPVFSRLAAEDAWKVRRVAMRWATLLLLVGAATALIGWVFAPWIVRALFARGTFSASDVDSVSNLLRYGLVQLPCYFSGLVLASLHSSRGNYRALALSGVLGLAVKVAAAWVLIKPLKLNALMISAAVMYLANLLWLLGVALYKRDSPALYANGNSTSN